LFLTVDCTTKSGISLAYYLAFFIHKQNARLCTALGNSRLSAKFSRIPSLSLHSPKTLSTRSNQCNVFCSGTKQSLLSGRCPQTQSVTHTCSILSPEIKMSNIKKKINSNQEMRMLIKCVGLRPMRLRYQGLGKGIVKFPFPNK